MSPFEHVPVVELGRRPNGAIAGASADQLAEICHGVGFFVAVDHGIDDGVVDDVFTVMERFFALPRAERELIDKRRSRHFRGWEDVGAEQTNNRPDLRQQIDLWSEWPAHDRDVHPEYRRLLGPNQWMPDDVVPGFRPALTRWFTQLGALADDLLAVFAEGLGLPNDHFAGMFGEGAMSLTKLIDYPPTPAGAAGVNAHHDAGFLTLLATDGTPGLQVQNEAGEWIDVPHVAGSFVVNLGEMLQGMTANYFVATPHRVITERPRRSAGYFHGPALDTPLEPLPLAPRFHAAVAASARHAGAGFMASRDETDAGVGEMASSYRATTYGEQLWNYFSRSYPDLMAEHYGT
jgi:isopenicillin N synthase-like dioxygenase